MIKKRNNVYKKKEDIKHITWSSAYTYTCFHYKRFIAGYRISLLSSGF